MLIYNRIESSRANGPGNRAVIWTAGCTLKCPGCWNPETHAFSQSKNVPVADLVTWVLGLSDIEGVTFSGGEPLQQIGSLAAFCQMLKARRPDLSIAAYTGFTRQELVNGTYTLPTDLYLSHDANAKAEMALHVLTYMDFIIAGRYNSKLRCTDKPLCGSSNQEVVFLTDRYSEADLTSNIVEMIIDPAEDLLQITGFPSDADALTAR